MIVTYLTKNIQLDLPFFEKCVMTLFWGLFYHTLRMLTDKIL